MGFLYYRRWMRACPLAAVVAALLTPLVLTAGWRVGALPDGQETVKATLDADGRAFTFVAPGMTGCRAGWSATIEINGKRRVLSSADGQMLASAAQTSEATPYGQAKVTETIIRFEQEQVALLFRLAQVPGVPGVLAQAGIRNGGQNSVNLVSVTPVAAEFTVSGSPDEWLVTALDQSVNEMPPVVALREIRDVLKVREYGSLYRPDGLGFLFGPVGTPVAYVDARIAQSGGGKVSFLFAADMSGARVDPGETRWGQQVVLLIEPPRVALARWAEWVGKTHGACIDKDALSGWHSWNFLGEAVTGKDVLAVVDEVLSSSARLRFGVIQIDDGYQDITRRKETNDKFPEGLAFYAQHIATTGARPGLFLDFFGTTGLPRPVDSKNWGALVQRVEHAVKSGFTYLKISYVLIGVTPGEKRTAFEIYRDDYAAIRKAAGKDVYLAYCDTRPNRATVGLVDASRIGADPNRTARVIAGTSQADLRFAMTDVLRSYQLHGRWFAVDHGTYYMGTDSQNLSEIVGTWPLVRTWMSMVGLSCGTAFTSDPLYHDSFKPFWRNVEVMTPPARERTEVLDLCTSRDWPRLAGHVRRAWGDSTVALLWNPFPAETSIGLDFAGAGMDPKRRYAVWSFWDKRYLGVAKGAWATPAMQPLVSQHVCFTDLDRTPNRPVLIGSSLHIYCGAVEIKHVVSLPGAMTIELTDAGASEGDLFVYSKWMPFLKTASGCTVRSVINVGENAWRISVSERKAGVPQYISLGILLPVIRQTWFWALIAAVAGSLVFALWRYVIGLRLQRVHALEQERGRIARDLHDDLGSTLTQIAYLGDTLLNRPGLAPDLAGDIDKMRATAIDATRTLDEAVWAVDPAQDTLESLAGYLAGLAQQLLTDAQVGCRLDIPDTLPPLAVPSDVRHHLFLAVKEALHNVIRHARATEADIRLTVQPPDCRLVIADNGRGFETEAAGARAGGGHGLGNIRKRLEAIGGRCEIRSRTGSGTEIELNWRLPL